MVHFEAGMERVTGRVLYILIHVCIMGGAMYK